MVGVDTNVLLRFFVIDDEAQHKAVVRRFSKMEKAGEKAFVSSVVIAELVWGLRSIYGYSRSQIANVVEAILEGALFEVDGRSVLSSAVKAYRSGGPDLADLLILELALDRGARALLTFDAKLRKRSDCESP
ncbi:MAG: type II toxin-antitoxin system VapC family toxin [Polyangiaceae bacterium]